jgi:NAD(P)-dependent dehydrogenase (short-subunit alcohol dehydrogenase family)
MSPRQHQPISELIDLTGRRAIVTGGGSGIGLAIARRLAEAGASVLIADIDGDLARATSAELKGQGHSAFSAQCDVSQAESVRAMTSAAAEAMGGVDILVNNAGVYPRKPLAETTAADFAQVLAVNLTGTFLCSREAAIRMIDQRRGGSIINIGSIDSVHPSADGLSAYDASKGGVLTLTKSLARELGKHGIRVNAIAPGGIVTQAIRSHMTGTTEDTRYQLKELKRFMARMALGRMGEPDEIARVALFLASDLSEYVTGSLVVADGGYLVS